MEADWEEVKKLAVDLEKFYKLSVESEEMME